MGDEAGNFRYIAGLAATGSTEGMEHIDLPAQLYAMFTHSGHISDLPKTVYTIWNKVLPGLGLQAAKAADFERYDQRFDGRTGRGKVEIWVPIVSHRAMKAGRQDIGKHRQVMDLRQGLVSIGEAQKVEVGICQNVRAVWECDETASREAPGDQVYARQASSMRPGIPASTAFR